ncbi:MAG: hypothetical protein RIB67_02150 [Miltoncostaeaceae bacterium]
MSRTAAHAAIAGMLVLLLALVGFQINRGALDEGALELPDPCARTVAIEGDSVDARAQRIALRGVDHTACATGTTREELLLRVIEVVADGGDLGDDLEDRLREGLRHGIDVEQDEGGINAVTAFALRQTVRFTPVDWLIAAVRELEPLLT